MARHPTARRTHRPAPSSDDVFVERVLETSAWARTHQRAIITLSITVLVLAVGVLWYRNYRGQLRERAATELAQLRQTVSSGNDALALRDLERFVERFDGTPSAPEARLMLAQAYLDSSQPPRAIETIQNLAGDLDEPLGPASAFLLADAHEAANQLDRAEEVLQRIADRAPFLFEKERALDAVARIRMERGDPAGAAQAYDRLLELLPANNPDRVIYEMRRAEAHARALAGPRAPVVTPDSASPASLP